MYIDKSTLVRDIMTTDVWFVRPDDSLQKVSDIFNGNNIHHLPVVDDDGKVKGMISKSDYLRLQHGFTLFKTEKAEEYNQAIFRSLLVGEVMTKQVAKLMPDFTLDYAAGIFRENLFHAMPVVDEHGKLVGILSTYDLLKYAYRDEALLACAV